MSKSIKHGEKLLASNSCRNSVVANALAWKNSVAVNSLPKVGDKVKFSLGGVDQYGYGVVKSISGSYAKIEVSDDLGTGIKTVPYNFIVQVMPNSLAWKSEKVCNWGNTFKIIKRGDGKFTISGAAKTYGYSPVFDNENEARKWLGDHGDKAANSSSSDGEVVENADDYKRLSEEAKKVWGHLKSANDILVINLMKMTTEAELASKEREALKAIDNAIAAIKYVKQYAE